jgi:hypothetical protein
MKRTLTLILSLISLIAGAQEPQIIGGYLLDGQDSFEEPEEHLANSREDGMYFPLHLQSSYKRESPKSPLSKCRYNIGMSVTGRKM